MSSNRINITLGDMNLIQVDMLAELMGMSRSEYIGMLINKEYSIEEFHGNVSYDELHHRFDARLEERLKGNIKEPSR